MEFIARPRPTGADELKAELIRNAAFVAHEGQKAKALSRWLNGRKDRRILYVFDTDVIKAHCAPWLSGPADDVFLGRGYGQILPQKPYDSFPADQRQNALFEERRRAEAVCWLLANKALRSALDRQFPILQTNSHFDETLRVFEAVKSNAKVESIVVRTSVEERQDHFVDQTLRFIKTNVEANKWPLEENPGRFLSNVLHRMQMRDLQRSSPFVREWDGFLDLVRRGGGLFELSEFRASDGTLTPGQEKAWANVCSELKGNDFALSPERLAFHRVFQRIVAPERYQHSRERLEVDIEALADLALVNLRLSQSEDSLRVVFITGDRKMVLGLAAAQEALREPDRITTSQFAFEHVHHLWSFVDTIAADAAGLSKMGGPRSELFSGFLAFGDEEKQPTSDLHRLVRYAIKAEPNLTYRLLHQDVEHAYDRWDDFAEDAANLHRYFLANPANIERISQLLIEKLRTSDPSWDPDKLRAIVQETMARARDRTNVEFSEIGANSILDAHRHGVRNPPDLMFDSLKTTDKIFKDLALPRRVFVNAEDFARRFERIVDDCYQPDPNNAIDDDHRQECYLKYLVLGALFASANRWLVAEQHAESAVRIIERAEHLKDPIRTLDPQSNMSGREAYYLLAVATRVRAKNAKGYSDAHRRLNAARARLEDDRGKKSGLRVPFIRFDCEALALALARYYHARSRTSSSPFNDLADEVFRKARAVIEEREAMRRRQNDPDLPDGDKIGHLPTSTRTSIATNLLQVAVIAHFRNRKNYAGKESSPIDHTLMAAELDTLIEHTNLLTELARISVEEDDQPTSDRAEIIFSPMMMLYAVVAAMMTGDNRIWRPRTTIELDGLFKSRQFSVTDYDRWRYDMLHEFSSDLLSAQEAN